MTLDPTALLPRPVRLALYAAACAVLLYVCLAPSEGLPQERIWDKAEHAMGWAVLTGLGLFLSPRRPRAIAGFAFGLGVAVEVLQAALPFGRDGDVRDLLADSIGIGLALLVWATVTRLGRRIDAR
ncbi:VanZ family protein [Phenylobacterium deserti]|uniref:VanZ family protein n=1 Tax=Phenylobacterium deserti TaxID=1914756 RepID=A0A328AQI9_9CAUL|nr:VanZ family protein [Phenylobacterium deserti]RAK57282.1 VanZ family protein [Phenylobacterium deserti]